MPDRSICHVGGCSAPATREFIAQPIPNFVVHWPVCDGHGHNLDAGDAYEGDGSHEIVLRHQWGERRS